ncbi:hypothetical protein [Cerasicoccus arenae]|uniref:Uncharacterized protein n=1 Tax=Cerasicoccus arenae TaxID=424488 RepID=A0A8J3DKY3_9BACT|nr:hypothetical protein [Cerasicoccus arenae]MBK1857622.1 hypothetical protein [Cerasicoccus arenae]GHC05515.1 hypothetical protein GCM10007047_23040 [Cerasicoccus arenae]
MKYLCTILLLAGSSLQADDLAPFSDEFNNAATFSKWQDLAAVEGWVAPAYELADIDTTEDGYFHIVPAQNTWFGHLRGLLFYKEVTGDFVVTAKLRILSRHNPGDPTEVPSRSFSLSGIFVHGPRNITHAAPDPYTTSAVWPPQDFGSDYLPNTENYIFLSYGTAGNPGTRQFEIKCTRNSNSQLYYNNTGIDQNETEVWLQMVRVGDTIVCMRKHGEAEPWIVENRYPNAHHPFPAFGDTLQVGVTAYTDWETAGPFNSAGLEACFHFNYAPPAGNPDLISQVDYFRFRRPDPALTELVLQSMSVSYDDIAHSTANPPIELSASPAAAVHLGDNANLVYDPYGDWVTAQFGITPDPADITPDADPDNDNVVNLIEFTLGSDPQTPSHAMAPIVQPSGSDLAFSFTPNITDGATLEVRHSTNMIDWTTIGSRAYEGGDWTPSGPASVNVNGLTDEVTVSIPAAETPQFLMLQASQ